MDIQIVDYIKDQKKNNSEITHEDELQLTINFCKAKIRSNMEVRSIFCELFFYFCLLFLLFFIEKNSNNCSLFFLKILR